jgi:hypothetical protein
MKLAPLIAATLAMGACFKVSSAPDVRPIERALATAVPVAYVATVATAAFAGQPTPCAQPLGPVVNISVDSSCPLPMMPDASGMITVTRIGDASAGILGAVFTNVNAGARTLVIQSVDAITVNMQDGKLVIAYVDEDVKLTSPDGAMVKQSSWAIEVDPRTTPGDTRDDLVSIDGADQRVLNAETTQTALTGVKLDAAACRANPIAGNGTIQTARGSSALGSTGVTSLTFHSACDGRAMVNVSLTALASSGGTVELDLLN